MNETTILIRSDNVTYQVVDDEAILIRLDTGNYYSLNRVATIFWELLDGESTVAEHASTITRHFNRSSADFVAELRALAEHPDPSGRIAQATDLAGRYGVEASLVSAKLPMLAGPEAERHAADLLESHGIALEAVTADLLELAADLDSEKLVEIVG
jgi:hypothetical protein